MTHQGEAQVRGGVCRSDMVDGHADDVDEADLHSRQFAGSLVVHRVEL